jgi:hypothetical protein
LADEAYIDYMKTWSKRYLGRVRATIHTVAMVRSEIDELDSLMDGVRSLGMERTGQPSDDDALPRKLDRMDSLRAEFAEELDRNMAAQSDAHRRLSHVRQPLRALLTYRYLEGLTWSGVVEKFKSGHGLPYSEDHIRKDMHDAALIELFPYVPHEYDELPEAI